ncbi:MAG TPA: hypothetical protein VD994_04565 [Prosthecobacter sp.]|nr:hypothetical protein [Prosthecobacter sp.]
MKPKVRRLLEWLDRAALLESQIVGSGLSGALNEALVNGWVELADVGIKERSGIPATAFAISQKGREALK